MVGQFIWSGHMVKTLGKDTWSRYFSRKLVMTLDKDGFLLRCLDKTHFSAASAATTRANAFYVSSIVE